MNPSVLDAMDRDRIPYKVVDGKLRVGKAYKCALTDDQRAELAVALADEGEYLCAECRGMIRGGHAVVDTTTDTWRHLWCADKANGNTAYCDAARAAGLYWEHHPLLKRTDLPAEPVRILPHITITPATYVPGARMRLKALAHREPARVSELNQIEEVLTALHTQTEKGGDK